MIKLSAKRVEWYTQVRSAQGMAGSDLPIAIWFYFPLFEVPGSYDPIIKMGLSKRHFVQTGFSKHFEVIKYLSLMDEFFLDTVKDCHGSLVLGVAN